MMNQKTSLQRRLSSRPVLRAISVLTVIAFLCSDLLAFPSQASAQTASSTQVLGGIDTSLLASASATSGKVQELVVPPEFGTITEMYGVRSTVYGVKADDKTPYSVRPTVFLIQDAHAVPDAQRSLEKLIEYFQTAYGVRTIALEGAEGKLDPDLFRNFADKEKLGKVFDAYLDTGELSGAAAASVLSKTPADYVGIEDWKLYQEGVTAYLAGLKAQPAVNDQRATLNEELTKLKSKYYSPEAQEFDAKVREWQADAGKLTTFLEYLSVRSTEYGVRREATPNLNVVFGSLALEKRKDLRMEAEVKALAKKVHELAPSPALNGLVQDYRTGRISSGEFAYQLSKRLEPFQPTQLKRVPVSPELRAIIENHGKLETLTGAEFSKELDAFLAEVRTKLFVTAEAKAVSELDDRLRLIGKLVRFELSRKEWEDLQVRSTEYGAKTCLLISEILKNLLGSLTLRG